MAGGLCTGSLGLPPGFRHSLGHGISCVDAQIHRLTICATSATPAHLTML
jgi:hypothetical protein